MAQEKSKRGLASADEETRREVSKMGGKASQQSGHAHKLTDEERSRGGRRSSGNFANRPKEEVSEIGRRGGEASHAGRRRKSAEGEEYEEGITG